MIYSDSYLYLSRHNIYYFRAIIPDGVREGLHKLEYRRSLQTRSLQVARNMARVLRVCFETHLEGIRSYMMSWEELRKILDSRLVQLMSQEKEKLRINGPYPLAADDIWKENVIPDYQRVIKDISELRSSRVSNSYSGDLPKSAIDLAENILVSANIDLDRSSDQFVKFCEATVRMYLEFTQQRIILNHDAKSFQVTHPVTMLQSPEVLNHHKTQPISELVEKYCKEMVSGGNWTPKTETEYRAVYKLLVSLTNDMMVASVDYQAAQFLKETLMKLPSNMNKKPLYREKTVNEVVAMKIPKDDLLSTSKVNAYIGRISQFFIWLVKNGYVQVNPFSGLKLKEKTAGHEKRKVFDNADLVALFSSPEFQASDRKHPYYYWLPLLGLFTGARIDELCQLYLDDVYQNGDLWVIDINDNDDKKLKNSCARVIPIHSRLIDLGLIEYVSTLRKNGHTRLFPELKKGRDGYSQAASKWFSRYSTRCGVIDNLKTFHSFRHTVINFLKQRNEVKEKVSAIVGHKETSITMGWYGKPYEPSNLVSTIESLDFQIEVISYVQ